MNEELTIIPPAAHQIDIKPDIRHSRFLSHMHTLITPPTHAHKPHSAHANRKQHMTQPMRKLERKHLRAAESSGGVSGSTCCSARHLVQRTARAKSPCSRSCNTTQHYARRQGLQPVTRELLPYVRHGAAPSHLSRRDCITRGTKVAALNCQRKSSLWWAQWRSAWGVKLWRMIGPTVRVARTRRRHANHVTRSRNVPKIARGAVCTSASR